MAKLTGTLKNEDKPFSGSLIITALSGTVEQFNIQSGKPTDEIDVKPGHYNVQLIPEDAKKMSSYPQYKWRIADSEEVDFDKIEIEPLA